jgi:predicted SAM-dependent methyltransferase
MKRLNLGCGKTPIEGWINVDKIKLDGIDVIHDLDKFPYPFDNGSADYVLLNHVLEHLDDVVKVMEEVHRILKLCGKVEIAVPYYKHENAFTDPTHKHFFTEHSMDYFLDGNNNFADWYSEKKFKLVKFEKHNGGFPFWHIKKYLGITLPFTLPFRITELRWILEVEK